MTDIPENRKAIETWKSELLRPVGNDENLGIRMDSIGNWSCARLGLRGYRTRRQLLNAIKRKSK